MRVLVTGATGYIGGRLVPELLAAGHQVRVLVRHPERLVDRPWSAGVEVVTGDAESTSSLRVATADMDVAYYLMHSLTRGGGFHDLERRMAQRFASAANEHQLRRIVYMGALAPHVPDDRLSAHLRSRSEVGAILRASGVPTAELRAAAIIGSGSVSFEMVRHLTERLPFMVTPRWVRTPTQPIAVRDVLRYLLGAAKLPADVNRVFEIGGPDTTTYEGMIQGYATVAGLRERRLLRVPVLTPSLSSHWVGAVTPIPSSIARPLVDSLTMTTVCTEHDIADYIPDPPGGLLSFQAAIGLAIKRIQDADVSTIWSASTVPGAPSDPLPSDPDWAGGALYTDERETVVEAPPAALWRVIEGVGGDRGYYSSPVAWEVRGWLDRIAGGVGLHRGRRDPDRLRVGDPVDFWRVEERAPLRMLRLRAEMRLPGRAWLELGIRKDADAEGHEQAIYTQRALFYPRGLWGQVYWFATTPFHGRLFGSMLRNVRDEAERQATDPVAGQRSLAGGDRGRLPGSPVRRT